MTKIQIGAMRVILLYLNENGHAKIPDLKAKTNMESNDLYNLLEIMEKNMHQIHQNCIDSRNENQGVVDLVYNGEQFAEDLRSQTRWDKVIEICDSLDSYSINTVLNVLGKLIQKEIDKHID